VESARARCRRRAWGSSLSAIECYLHELRRQLGRDPLLRRRVLAEVEDHLREAAARDGEDAAIERFGPPEHLARELGVERASSAAVWAAAALVLAAGGFLAAYVVGENTPPPAPWPTEEATPSHLRWKLATAEIVFAVAARQRSGLLRTCLDEAHGRDARALFGCSPLLHHVRRSRGRGGLPARRDLRRPRRRRPAVEPGDRGRRRLVGFAHSRGRRSGHLGPARVSATAQRASRSYGFSR
jgi:hypothetical protein